MHKVGCKPRTMKFPLSNDIKMIVSELKQKQYKKNSLCTKKAQLQYIRTPYLACILEKCDSVLQNANTNHYWLSYFH